MPATRKRPRQPRPVPAATSPTPRSSAARRRNSLFEASGGSNIYETKDMQRLWRDATSPATHHGLMWDIHGLAYGRAAAGLSIMDTGVR